MGSAEQWRKKMGLEQMVLLGCGFGAYLSCTVTVVASIVLYMCIDTYI